jgi:hypothetical protein
MADYVVLLREQVEPPSGSRHAIYESGKARTAAFQDRLRDFLKRHGVADQVAAIGEPTFFPIVALRATSKVVELVRTLPEVEEVVRDNPKISTLAGQAGLGR